MNVAQHRQKILFVFNGLASEPILKQMPAALVFDVEPIYVTRGNALHDLLKRFLLLFDQKMYMISHQTVCVQSKAADLLTFCKDFKKMRAVFFILKDLLTVDTA